MLIVLSILLTSNAFASNSSSSKTVNVTQAGTLSNYISDAEKYSIEELTITGPLNGTDFRLIREMAGNNYLGQLTDGKVKVLNLAGVSIDVGGEMYLDTEYVWYSVNIRGSGGHYSIQNADQISKGMFIGCQFENIILPNSVSEIEEEAFFHCTKLISITIPENIKKIGDSAFQGCDELETASLPSGLESLGRYAFAHDKKLVSINIPKGITVIEGATFYGCNSLEKIELPNGLLKIEEQSFEGCTSLKTVSIPQSVYSIRSGPFASCTSLSEIVVDANNDSYISVEGVLYDKNFNEIIQYPAGKAATEYTVQAGVKYIGRATFSDCNKLVKVNLPESVIHFSGNTFYGCSSLTEIEFPKNVKEFWYSEFEGCTSLQTIISHIEDPTEVSYYPYDSSSLFDTETYNTATLYIPNETKGLYKQTKEWKDFINIVEMEPHEPILAMEKIEVEGNRMVGSEHIVRAYIKNEGAEFNGSIYRFTSMNENVKGSIKSSIISTIPSGAVRSFAYSFTPDQPGTYYIWISADEACEEIIGSTTITINDPPITVTANNLTRQYGESNPVFIYSSDGGTLSGVPEIICEATATSPVGTYPIIIRQGTITNNNVTYINGTLTITKAPLTVKADNKTMNQGDQVPNLTLSYQGFKNGETENVLTQKPTVKTTANSASTPGTYPITVSGGSAVNYELYYIDGTLTVIQTEQITITVKDCQREYGQQNPIFEYTVVGGTVTGRPDFVCNAKNDSPVGNYEIIISKGEIRHPNVVFVNGTLTVNKAPLTITAENKTMKQGDPLPEFTFRYDGFMRWDGPEVLTKKPVATTNATSQSSLGTYPIYVSGAEATNYNISYKTGVLTITQADLITVRVKDAKRKYGDPNPTFEYTVIGGELKGNPTISCDANNKSPVGNYQINICKGSITNPNVNLVEGMLYVEQAPLTAKADDKTMTEGDEVPELTVTYIGLKNGETKDVFLQQPTLRTTATRYSSPGTYQISIFGGQATNYDFNYEYGTMTVVPSQHTPYNGFMLIITLKDGKQDKYLLTEQPQALIEGNLLIIKNQSATMKYSRADINDFTFHKVVNDVEIEPSVLIAKSYTRQYGEQNPTFTFTSEGPAYQGTPIITTTANASSPVGKYPIVITKGSIKDESNVHYVYGTLTITKAPLTVKADDKTMNEGGELPELTVSYTGFKNNDTKTKLYQEPQARTTATSQSKAGKYPIIVSGGADDNYYFIYTDGTLTIEKPEGYYLWMALNDGRKEKYQLSEKPEVLFIGNNVQIITPTVNVSYARSDIKEFWFDDYYNTNIEEPEMTEQVLVFRQIANGHYVVRGLSEGEAIKVYNMKGQLVTTVKAVGNTETDIILPQQMKGVFIINISNKRTIKIQKK